MSVIASVAVPARRLVLVADDEPAIQHIVVQVTRQLGFDPLPVSDGAAAVAAVVAHRGALACAILDVVMPTMSGVDAAHAIQQIDPHLPIVLMSGAIPAHYAEPIKRLHLAGLLHKPFSLMALRNLIRQAGDAIAIPSA